MRENNLAIVRESTARSPLRFYAVKTLYHGSKLSNDIRQTRGDLAEGTDFDGVQELGENIPFGAGHVGETLQCLGGPVRVFLFEGAQPLDLRPLLPRRGAGERDVRHLFCARITVEPDDGALSAVDLLLVSVSGLLNLAALIALLHGVENSAEIVDFAEQVENGPLHL